MRDMHTELLRGFAAFSEGQTIRLRKVEADQSNLDAALSGRVNVVESTAPANRVAAGDRTTAASRSPSLSSDYRRRTGQIVSVKPPSGVTVVPEM